MSHGSTSPLRTSRKALILLTLGATGVVYGDIGTSPLYAMKESFHHLPVTPENVYGILSLMFWAMTLVVTMKYVLFLLDINHEGEGGITALMALVKKQVPRQWTWYIVTFGILGVMLLYGDGAITPAISVLSAVEGLGVITPTLEDLVIPITVLILISLFQIQRYGTGKVGGIFGPYMVLWFIVLSLLGIPWIVRNPSVLQAVNPWYAFRFFIIHGKEGFLALGSVVLVITGGEALYADMGHFGAKAIRIGWLGIAMPALMLNYFGQAALLIANPEYAHQPFYSMAPSWSLVPLVIFATGATIIASQALITGAFSLTKEIMNFHAIPSMTIVSTSREHSGQIYVPEVNKILLLACVALVLLFKTSSALAAAYGIAVTATMSITTILSFFVFIYVKHWHWLRALTLCLFFIVVDLTFFGSNLPKFSDGGWVPITFAGIATILSGRYYIWKKREINDAKQSLPQIEDEAVREEWAIVGVSHYVTKGTIATSIEAHRLFGDKVVYVHFGTSAKRASIVQQLMHDKLGKEVEIIDVPSGDILLHALEYIREFRTSRNVDVCFFLTQTVEGGDNYLSLHPTAQLIMSRIVGEGCRCTIVPWKPDHCASEKINLSPRLKLLGYIPGLAKLV